MLCKERVVYPSRHARPAGRVEAGKRVRWREVHEQAATSTAVDEQNGWRARADEYRELPNATTGQSLPVPRSPLSPQRLTYGPRQTDLLASRHMCRPAPSVCTYVRYRSPTVVLEVPSQSLPPSSNATV